VGKFLREMLPLAAGVALFGLLIAVLLQGGNLVGNWLLAAFLLGHGWIHAMYVMPQPKATATTASGAQWAFELDHSKLLAPLGLTVSGQRTLGTLLVAGIIAGFSIAALATVPLIVPAEAWSALVVGSSVASLALMGLFFHRGLIIGIAIDVVLLWVALASVWLPAV
jgi:hypothetical protein